MFDKLKYLWNRISQKFEGNLARKEEVVDFQDLERTRRRLEQMRFRTTNNNPESTGSVAMDQVRRRMTSDMHRDPTASSVQRNRQAINKWLHREDYEPANFDSTQFNQRLEASHRYSGDRVLEPLPAVEDTFMAFSRPEENLFEDNAISLSGVHYKVDPLEEGDDIFLPTGANVQNGDEQEVTMDFTPLASFAPDSEGDPNAVKVSNPMIQTLATLEERMSKGYRTNDGFWVGGGGN